MIAKIKWYLIGALILFFFILVTTVKIQHNKIIRIRIENKRLSTNQDQLLAENLQIKNLNLKKDEVTGRLKRERDSLAAALKIKPKQIDKIIYIDNSTHDTVKVPVLVEIMAKGEWLLRDSSRCFKYASKLVLEGDSLIGERQLFEYNNRTIQTFYKKRPHKCWFIQYGRWQYLQKIDSECGDVKFQSFTFLKE